MQTEFVLNSHLLDWITIIIKDLLETAIEETPEKVPILIETNNIIKQLDNDICINDITNFVSENLTDKIFEEIKKSI